jgi:hypothetical protein
MAAAALALANPERRRGEREVERGSGAARASPTQEGTRTRGNAVERDRAHGCHAPSMRQPLRCFVEHVACNEVAKVGRDLGWLPGRLWTGA